MHYIPIIAALLHDIGKFAQRAEAKASYDLIDKYCPYGKTHQHVLYTDYLLKESLFPLPTELEQERHKIAQLAAAHHKPDLSSREEKALQKADHLSSGADRMDGEPYGNHKTARMESIFNSIELKGKGLSDTNSKLRYNLKALDDGDYAIFPTDHIEEEFSYQKLYELFRSSLKDVPTNFGIKPYIHSIITILERYTWCIPSSTYKTSADVSLYDHSVTTAAIVQALLACPENDEHFLLVGGDISGIQKFIFGDGEANKNTGKLLRARSFLLQALSRSIWLNILDDLNLSSVARLMDAGGRFMLLLPNTSEVKQYLDQLKPRIERYLLKKFNGSIRLNFAYIEIEPYDLSRDRYVQYFEKFNDAIEQAKQQPFYSLFQKHVSPVLPSNYKPETGECVLCLAHPATHKLDEEDATATVCDLCFDLSTKIGRILPNARYIVYDRLSDGIELFGSLYLRLYEQKPQENIIKNAVDVVSMKDYKSFSAAPIAGYIPVIKSKDIQCWSDDGRLSKDGNTLSNEIVKEGQPKTFSILAEESRIANGNNSWRSIPCIAACKADVDNLGLLFSIGFGTDENSKLSISRFAMLARMLNHFFSTHLIQVIRKEYKNIYVIFAGGDDLFVLGPWAETIDFALRLHSDFQKFTGYHPAVTISTGLSVSKPKLPVRMIRNNAENALESAKHLDGKNAVSLFSVTTNWDEFEELINRGKQFEEYCLNGDITQGLARRLLVYTKDCKEFQQGAIRKGLYVSHLNYDLGRNCKNSQISDLLKSLVQSKKFPDNSLSFTYALYRVRTTQ